MELSSRYSFKENSMNEQGNCSFKENSTNEQGSQVSSVVLDYKLCSSIIVHQSTMADLVGGAVLGVAFTELWNAVKEANNCVKDFKPKLRNLEKTLGDLAPIIQDIETINTQLNASGQIEVERLKSIMEEGKGLVSKCRSVSRWDILKKPRYRMMLVELDNKIIKKHIELCTFRGVKYLRLQVNELSDQIQSLGSYINRDEAGRTGIMSSIGSSAEDTAGPSESLVPPPVPRAARIGGFTGLFGIAILSGIKVTLKFTLVIIIIYKVMIAIVSMLGKSDSWISVAINDAAMLETIKQLRATMRSLDHVLKDIESNSERVLMTNDSDYLSEDPKSSRNLLVEGEKLVYESTNIGWWIFVKKWEYHVKMVALNNKLLRFHLKLYPRLAKYNCRTTDDSEIKDDESIVPVHYYYDEDLRSELWDEVCPAKDPLKDFKLQLSALLDSTLQMLDPMIQELKEINRQLKNESDESEIKWLKTTMRDGKKLISKCCDISRRQRYFSTKSRYEKKLAELENECVRFNISYSEACSRLAVERSRLEQSWGFKRMSYQIESLGPSTSSIARAAPKTSLRNCSLATDTSGMFNFSFGLDFNVNNSRPLAPPPVPTRAARVGFAGYSSLLFLPGVEVTVKIIVLVIIIYKAMATIIAMLEKSDNEIWLLIKDVGMLKTTMEQLDATVKLLEPVLGEIESNSEQMVMLNEEGEGEDAEGLRSLLEEGGKLIFECSNMGWCNFAKKWQCQKKMVELDNKLLRFYLHYLQARLANNEDKITRDDSKMTDDESCVPEYYDEVRYISSILHPQDCHEMKRRHMGTKEHETYNVLNNSVNPHQFSHYERPPTSIRSFQPHALGP